MLSTRHSAGSQKLFFPPLKTIFSGAQVQGCYRRFRGSAQRGKAPYAERYKPTQSVSRELYLTTCRSFVDDEISKVTNHWTEQLQLELHLRVIQATIDLSREGVELNLFRTIIHGGPEKRKEMGLEPLEQHLVDALLQESSQAKGKRQKSY